MNRTSTPPNVAQNRAVEELHAAVRRLASDIPPAAAKVQDASTAVIDEHEKLARAARRTRSNPALRAVKAPAASDLTAKFKALR